MAIVCEYAIVVSVHAKHAHTQDLHFVNMKNKHPCNQSRWLFALSLSLSFLDNCIALPSCTLTRTHRMQYIRLAYCLPYHRPVTGNVITCDGSVQIMAHVRERIFFIREAREQCWTQVFTASTMNESVHTRIHLEMRMPRWLSKYCAYTHTHSLKRTVFYNAGQKKQHIIMAFRRVERLECVLFCAAHFVDSELLLLWHTINHIH